MSDTRHQNIYWKLQEARENGKIPNVHVQFALLMDLRDELKKLNRVFECPRFLDIPSTLNRIARNTARPKRARKATK